MNHNDSATIRNNEEFPDGTWVAVYKVSRESGKNVFLHPDDERALFSLMLHLWNTNYQSFLLNCCIDRDGRVTLISDISLPESGMVFHSRTRHWGDLYMTNTHRVTPVFSGYQNLLRIGDDIVSANPPPIDFPCLRKVGLYMPFLSFAEAILSWMVDKNPPSLKELHFVGASRATSIYTERILTILRTLDVRLAKKITHLFLGSEFKANHLETLFVEILLPKFTNLVVMGMDFIDTSNLEEALDRILRFVAANKKNSFKSQLRRFVLDRSEDRNRSILSKLPILTRFLRTFNTINSLRTHDVRRQQGNYLEDPDLIYALITNYVGRILLEDRGHDDDIDSGSSCYPHGIGKNNKSCLPRSAWPFLLERAQHLPDYPCQNYNYDKHIGQKVTGIYYLLREGPILLGRRGPDRLSGVSNEKRDTKEERDHTRGPAPSTLQSKKHWQE